MNFIISNQIEYSKSNMYTLKLLEMQCYNKYKDSLIYFLTNKNNPNDLRIGSTYTRLSTRLRGYFLDKRNTKIAKHIREQGPDNIDIHLLERYPCENGKQLLDREQYYINMYKPNLNKLSASLSAKYETSKENKDLKICVCGLELKMTHHAGPHQKTWPHLHLMKIKEIMTSGQSLEKDKFVTADKPEVCDKCYLPIGKGAERKHLNSEFHKNVTKIIDNWQDQIQKGKLDGKTVPKPIALEYKETAKIYKIVNLLTKEIVYIGQSLHVYQRKNVHNNQIKDEKNNTDQLHVTMRKIGAENFEVITLEDTGFTDERQIHKREQFYIDMLKPTLNTDTAYVEPSLFANCECGIQVGKESIYEHRHSIIHSDMIKIRDEIKAGIFKSAFGYEKIDEKKQLCECNVEVSVNFLSKHIKTPMHELRMEVINKWKREYGLKMNDYVICNCNMIIYASDSHQHKIYGEHNNAIEISELFTRSLNEEKIDITNDGTIMCKECYSYVVQMRSHRKTENHRSRIEIADEVKVIIQKKLLKPDLNIDDIKDLIDEKFEITYIDETVANQILLIINDIQIGIKQMLEIIERLEIRNIWI